MNPKDIDTRFTYHAPDDYKVNLHKNIRDEAKDFAHFLNTLVPDSDEKKKAMDCLDEVVFWSNAAIARRS